MNLEEFLENYKKKIIIVSIILIILVIGLFNYFSQPEQFVEETKATEKVEEVKVEKEVKIENKSLEYVEIKGAVKNPGVYELVENMRIYNLIDLAGGLNEISYIGHLNLSELLKDEDMVIVLETNEEQINVSPFASEPVEIQQVSLNKGTLMDFQTLSGIGQSKAQAIIDYRNENGSFQDIEELKNVNGIGDATFEKIKDRITL